MKIRLLIFCLLLASCHLEKKGTLPRTECDKELAIAEKDFKNGKLVYCYLVGHFYGFGGYRSEEEMTEILKNYGILYQNISETDFIRDYDDINYCYCSYMREKINEKYGSHFIDSIVGVADEFWLSKRINDTIISYLCDIVPLYPGDTDNYPDERSETLSQELKSKLIYPEGYVKNASVDYPNYVNIFFDVNKYGNAKIRRYTFNFNSESKKIYEKYFEKQLEKYIKKTGWTPAQIRNHNVNSTRFIRYYFD